MDATRRAAWKAIVKESMRPEVEKEVDLLVRQHRAQGSKISRHQIIASLQEELGPTVAKAVQQGHLMTQLDADERSLATEIVAELIAELKLAKGN